MRCYTTLALGIAYLLGMAAVAMAAPPKGVLVPGTGLPVPNVSDDFEDEKWEFYTNMPKSSENLDENQRFPAGIAKNDRWYEGMKRGTPDIVRRVPTPPGGLTGSKGSLLLQSMHTGIPGRPSYATQQDDFICDVDNRLGVAIGVHQNPSVVTRVYFPPFDQWEKRSGATFAFRTACYTHATITEGPNEGKFGIQTYWTGMFVEFESKADGRHAQDGAYFRIRANSYGGDFTGPRITKTGWWTLGTSFTPDGKQHFFAKPGLDDLTLDDWIGSEFSYGYRCEGLKTFFYNVCSRDDGRTWSTPWVVDDPKVYFVKLPVLARQQGGAQR